MNEMNYYNIFQRTPSSWLASRDENNIPDIIHCNGILPVTNGDQITFFVTGQHSEKFMANMKSNGFISLIAADTQRFESYQYKGQLVDLRPSTKDEIEFQLKYLTDFMELLSKMRYEDNPYRYAFFHPPFFTVTMKVSEIFDQTPRKGTGNKISSTLS